ncbi:hypothetical protein AAFF_G00222550 [Aldrovandia affinis]|uniref:Uncharacterized protein n=1 Tax=Aldrovandia affinis TaxID=143900 RepID=A0AAD7RG15_9TELE|nr:hypothetical protein AAFF_G00222550 [Aldrovandia affinis]
MHFTWPAALEVQDVSGRSAFKLRTGFAPRSNHSSGLFASLKYRVSGRRSLGYARGAVCRPVRVSRLSKQTERRKSPAARAREIWRRRLRSRERRETRGARSEAVHGSGVTYR